MDGVADSLGLGSLCSVCMYVLVCMYGHHIWQSMDQPGKVASPARGQMKRENEYFSVPVRA